jgi:hypothetical protein
MKRVFAVLFFLLLLCGCDKASVLENKNIIVHKNENILSSIPGDFDGDKYPEYIYIASSDDNKPYIKLIDGDRAFYKELSFKLDNYSSNVQDVNGDDKEDVILYCIEENSQKVYVFSYYKDLYTLFSPETLDKFVEFNKNKDGYTIICGKFEKKFQSKEDLELKFFYTALDYREDGPIFESVGTISSNKGIISTVSAIFKLTKDGSVYIEDLSISPYVEPEDE